MRRPNVPAAAALALALAGCTPEFDPASFIEKLRVVAVQAEPPELQAPDVDPSSAATLSTLVLRPDFATTVRTTTIVHVACVPDPRRPEDLVPCVMLPNLVEPAAMVAAGAQLACDPEAVPSIAWAPIGLVGVESCEGSACGSATLVDPTSGTTALPPRVTVPANFRFTDGGPDRTLGVQAQVLSFAVDATPDELVQEVGTICPAGGERARLEAKVAANLARLWGSREHVLSQKRLWIHGPAARNPPNRNPTVTGIRASDFLLDPAAPTTIRAGELELLPALSADPGEQPETYWKVDASGVPIEQATEKWAFSWFATTGELKKVNTHGGGDPDRWNLTEGRGRARVAVVVRDLRGGTSWAVRDVTIVP
jgi:hypothetical protein